MVQGSQFPGLGDPPDIHSTLSDFLSSLSMMFSPFLDRASLEIITHP